nr:subtilisin-like protease SBT4.9 isoform X2 [Tanacetum cinerariifolium]
YLSGMEFNSLRTSVSSSIVCPRLAALFTKERRVSFFIPFSGSHNRKDRVTFDSSRSYASPVVVFSNHWDSLDLLCEIRVSQIEDLEKSSKIWGFLDNSNRLMNRLRVRSLFSSKTGARYYSIDDLSSISAKDRTGHGTHVASIVAGNYVKGASYFGIADGVAKGGIPSARLAVYKVCDVVCHTTDLLSAFDYAIADGVDVLSVSMALDTTLGFTIDPIVIGSLHAVRRNILTSVAAGNEGPDLGSIKNSAPWMLTAGASDIDRRIIAKVRLGNGTIIEGQGVNAFPSSYRSDKHELSSTMLREVPKVQILKSEVVHNSDARLVATFSSRGPSKFVPNIIKPDVTAPGVEVLAVFSHKAAPSEYPIDNRSVEYNILSGTSMACPHVTAAAVYVKSFHPSWSPSAIKYALMTTAWKFFDGLHPEAEFAYGSGHINALMATDPGLVYETRVEEYQSLTATNASFPSDREINYPSMAALVDKQSFVMSIPRTVRNVGQANSTYVAVIDGELSYLRISVEPSTLQFTALNENLSFVVTVRGKRMKPLTTRRASLVWTDGVQKAIHMQIILEANGLWEMIEPNEKTQADNKKDKTAIAFLYQALPEEQLLQITKHKTAKAIWDALKTRHIGEERVQQASQSGHTMEDETLVRKLLNAIPDRYLQIVASIKHYSYLSEMTMEEAIGRLKTYEERIKYKRDKQVNNQKSLMFTRHEGQRKPFREYGHGRFNQSRGREQGKNNYQSKKEERVSFEEDTRDKSQVTCYRCHKLRHYAYESKVKAAIYRVMPFGAGTLPVRYLDWVKELRLLFGLIIGSSLVHYASLYLRDIYEAGFSLSCEIADVVKNGEWKRTAIWINMEGSLRLCGFWGAWMFFYSCISVEYLAVWKLSMRRCCNSECEWVAHLKQPIPPASVVPTGQHVAPEILAAHTAWIIGSKEIAGLMLMSMEPDIQRNLETLHAHEMLLELKTLTLEEELSLVLRRVAEEEKECSFGSWWFRASRKLKPGALSLYVGNGQCEAVEAIGLFNLCLPSRLEIVLNNCHYASSISRGVIYHFVNNTIQVFRNNMVYFSAIPRDGIFEIDLKKRIKKLQHDGLLDSTELKAFEKCVSCMSGKMARKHYTHQVERAKDLLGLIHTDHKHEVFETFKAIQKELENQLGKTIKSLHSDHEGENMSQEFFDHLKDHGIISHRTPPYTPQHNGMSERRNRTLLYMVQSMMSQTTLPKSFWDYALETAARILNMVQTKKIKKTPYERDTLTKPEKLEPRSIKCIFIGYPKKTIGYSFYYPPENKLLVAQNAKFLENSLITQEASGSLEDLKIIQKEDTYPSIDTSLNHKEDDLEIDEPQSDIVPIRRSTRTRHAPDRMYLYIDAEEHELGDLGKPANYKAALLDPESEKWLNAMNVEIQSMKYNEV